MNQNERATKYIIIYNCSTFLFRSHTWPAENGDRSPSEKARAVARNSGESKKAKRIVHWRMEWNWDKNDDASTSWRVHKHQFPENIVQRHEWVRLKSLFTSKSCVYMKAKRSQVKSLINPSPVTSWSNSRNQTRSWRWRWRRLILTRFREKRVGFMELFIYYFRLSLVRQIGNFHFVVGRKSSKRIIPLMIQSRDKANDVIRRKTKCRAVNSMSCSA